MKNQDNLNKDALRIISGYPKYLDTIGYMSCIVGNSFINYIFKDDKIYEVGFSQILREAKSQYTGYSDFGLALGQRQFICVSNQQDRQMKQIMELDLDDLQLKNVKDVDQTIANMLGDVYHTTFNQAFGGYGTKMFFVEKAHKKIQCYDFLSKKLKQIEIINDLDVVSFCSFSNRVFANTMQQQREYLQVIDITNNEIVYLPKTYHYFLNEFGLIGDMVDADKILKRKTGPISDVTLYNPEQLQEIGSTNQLYFKMGIDIYGFVQLPETQKIQRILHYSRMQNKNEIDILRKHGWNLSQVQNRIEFYNELKDLNSESSNRILKFLRENSIGFQFLFGQNQDQVQSESDISQEIQQQLQPFFCPITCQIINDPVVASDGFTYERQAIQSILDSDNPVSPITRVELQQFVFDNVFFKQQLRCLLASIFSKLDENTAAQIVPMFFLEEMYQKHMKKMQKHIGQNGLQLLLRLEQGQDTE